METETILTDDRQIASICGSGELAIGFRVDLDGVTKIEAYGEPALYCDMPWFAVYKSGRLRCSG